MFYYHINGKTRLLHIDILEYIFALRPDKWQKVPKTHPRIHYSDLDNLENSLIKNKFTAHPALVTKEYLAKKMDGSDHIPKTMIIKMGRIQPAKKPIRLTDEDKQLKWFLKPTGGWGGKDIKVFMGFNNYRKHIKTNNVYVLQQEVPRPILYDTKKFDIRTYVAFIYYKKKYHVYMFNESLCRVSLRDYNPTIASNTQDITNCSFQENDKDYRTEKINKLFSDLEWSKEMYEKFHHITGCTLKRMTKEFKKPNNISIEIMSFDYIVDQAKKPFLIEINRNIGYGFTRKPQYVAEMYIRMFDDLVTFGYEPVCEGLPLGEPQRWIPCMIF